MENVNGQQLHVKYQKIATEYAKIRAQANVLKKAVIDEQTRNSELKEKVKEKDVKLRCSELELDSLGFRNRSLTKRVAVLQEELDRLQNKSKKTRSKSTDNKEQPTPQTPPPNHVYVEEFQKKIVENAQLLTQLSDKELEIEELNDRIKHLECKLDLSEKSRLDLDARYIEKIEKLERDRNDIQRKLNERQKHDETTSWSSVDGKYDYDLKINHKVECSPYSSPSVSRRSSKSLGETSRIVQKTPDADDSDIEFVKLCDLEKELNQFKSDYNILKIKYDEMCEREKIAEICGGGGAVGGGEGVEPVEINNMIGRLKAPFAIPEEIEAREAKIRDYFLREIERLVEEKHICHAKNLAIAANNEVMSVHLENSEEEREKCKAALQQTLSNLTSLQEDTQAQEDNYKAQLSSLTEHLANMNEKLVKQTEEIQELRYKLEMRNEKQGRQK